MASEMATEQKYVFITMNLRGNEADDVAQAFDEVVRLIQQGNTSGQCSNSTHAFHFNVIDPYPWPTTETAWERVNALVCRDAVHHRPPIAYFISNTDLLSLALIEKMHANQHKINDVASALEISRIDLLDIMQNRNGDRSGKAKPDVLRRIAAYLELSVTQVYLLAGERIPRRLSRD